MLSHEELVTILDKLARDGDGANGPKNRLALLSFLAQQWQQEQSHYWTRFAGLAALQAGLLATAVRLNPIAAMCVAGIGLCGVALWGAIQLRSTIYVRRWKPWFHAYRCHQGIIWDSENEACCGKGQDSILATTTMALIAPVLVSGAWIIVLLASYGRVVVSTWEFVQKR